MIWKQLADTSIILIVKLRITRILIPITALFILDQDIAPGGYAWVFPKGKSKVNIGLGVQQKAMEEHNRKQGQRKDLKTKIDDYVKIESCDKESTGSRR